MVRIDQQNNILRNIFKLQDELKHIDDEENSCLSMALQRSQLKSAIQKKLNLQKVKYYSLANDRDFINTLTEDHYEKEMRFYEHILPKNFNFNNTTQHLFEKLMTKNDITDFQEDDDDSFQFQEMALNYLESTNKKNIGNVLLKKNFSSIFDDQPPYSDSAYLNDKIVSCYNTKRNAPKRNLCLRQNKKVRFINDKKKDNMKKLIISKEVIKPKENIATDSGKILETESNQIMNVDSEKIFDVADEDQKKMRCKKYSNVLNKRKILRKHFQKRGANLVINKNKNFGKIVSNTYPHIKLTLNRKKSEYSTVIKSKDNTSRKIDENTKQITNIESEKVIEIPNSNSTSTNTSISEVQTVGKRAIDIDEHIEEKKLKTQKTDTKNINIISNKIVQFNEIFKETKEKHDTIQRTQNSFEFTLFNQGINKKNDLNLEIISNQKLENHCFNTCDVFNTPPKFKELKQDFNENSHNQNSSSFCNENSNQINEQVPLSNTVDTEDSTKSFHSHTKYHPLQPTTITHEFFDESTNLDSDIFNLPKNNERNIYKLGDIAGIIVEYTLRRTHELCQNLSKKEQNGNLIIQREVLYIKHMLSLLQNVHSEIIENTECLLKEKNVRDIPRGLIKYISDQNRKILDMINTEQELLKHISYKLYK